MRLKIAIIGCGKVADRHSKIYKALSDTVKVVAVADISLERAERFADELSAKPYRDFRELLQNEPVDVVDIALPSGIHADIGMEVVRDFKRHLLVEKPLDLNFKKAKRLLEAAQREGLKVVTVFQNRANLPVIKVKELLQRGLFGRLVLLSARFYWSRGQSYYDSAQWRGTWALDGGVLAQQGCHFVDILHYLGGDVGSVFAKMGAYLVNIESDDLLIGLLHFKNGALGTIEATTCARPKDIKAEITILGEKGSAVISGFAMNRLEHLAIEGIQDTEDIVGGYRENPQHPIGYSHYTYMEAAARYFLDGALQPYLSTGRAALASIEIISGLYESAERGKEVGLPFKLRACKLGRGEGTNG